MLIEFTVGNFRSFKEPETFSMVAANLTSADPRLDAENVIPVDKELKLLTSAAIYGRNSSGKSNLVAALRFMRGCVLNSSKDTQVSEPIPVEPFLLSTETREAASFFEIAFVLEGQRYRYGFEVDNERIVSEWLFTVPTIREALLFQRGGTEINVSTRFKEGRGLQERTRPNALFLSVTAQFNGNIATKIVFWLRDLVIFSLDDWSFDYAIYCLASDKYRKPILDFIKRLDFGITDIEVESEKTSLLFLHDLQEEVRDIMRRTEAANRAAVKTLHTVYDGQGKAVATEHFDFDTHESEGTQKMLAMIGLLILVLEKGNPILVDEIDVKLHPLITRAIVHLFNSKETNPKGAQLIFATHDANLLDNRLLRRDQIWFVEKDRYGASHLVSLAEYRVRKAASFEKDYLQGRYGGIPSLGDLSHLFEEAHA